MLRQGKSRRSRGHALIMVTTSLIALCGIMGLAVDLGWGYYVKKFAQSAADSAALATAEQAFEQNLNDPMAGKGQPSPPTAAQAPATPVAGGTIAGGNSNHCTTLSPGSYYAVGNNGRPTNSPITITGCVNFSAGRGGFGDYVFFGGVNFSNPGTVVTMAPGRYIFAGVSGPQNSVYTQSNGVTVQDQTPMVGGKMVVNTDAGELLVFTDASYPGLYVPPALTASNFQFGSVNAQSAINLHGLNVNAAALPAELKTFAPTVMWQDQGNSKVLYDSNGKIDTSCGGNSNSPCTNNDPTVTTNGGNPSTSMKLQTTPGFHLYGVLYQPRGAALMVALVG